MSTVLKRKGTPKLQCILIINCDWILFYNDEPLKKYSFKNHMVIYGAVGNGIIRYA